MTKTTYLYLVYQILQALGHAHQKVKLKIIDSPCLNDLIVVQLNGCLMLIRLSNLLNLPIKNNLDLENVQVNILRFVIRHPCFIKEGLFIS